MQPITRRAALATTAVLVTSRARAQRAGDYPSRPLRLISPFAPGGPVDLMNQLLAERLSAKLGQPVVVDSRPGANTIVGTEALARSAPDGHTFMITASATVFNNPVMYARLPYDPVRDLSPITLVTLASVVLSAPARAPFQDMQGCLRWVRAQRRAVTYGSWGVGSAGHLYGELLKRSQGLELDHVPYRGEGAAILDMLAGRLDLTTGSPVGAKPGVEAGTLRVLGVMGDRRSEGMPDVPTFGELGLPGFDLAAFAAAYAPAGTPRPIIERLHGALVEILSDPTVRQRMIEYGQPPTHCTPEELAALQARDAPRWAELIRVSGARVE